MANTPKISVQSDLLRIVEELKQIAEASADTGKAIGETTKQVAKTVNDQVAVAQGGMNKLRKFAKDVANNLKNDFKNIFAVNALSSGLKLNEQFTGSIKQAVILSDTIRRLAPVFGMAEDRAAKFRSTLVKGLSEIGVGSEAAAHALEGLANTNVRGEKNLTEYAKVASELASISGQQGQEANVSGGLARVVVAQGGNPNDPHAMQKVAEDIVRIRNATGASATEALGSLEKLFSAANTDFKKRLMQGGGVSLASAGLIGGQGSTAFLERYFGLSKQARAGYDAQGLGGLVGANGQLNNNAFQNTIKEATNRGSGNTEFGLTTMGMSDDEAKGFLRLAKALNENGEAVERARNAVVDINDEYGKTMGLKDAFHANINHVKGEFSNLFDKMGIHDPLSAVSGAMSKASRSDVGSAAVVGGGAVLAAVLTTVGAKGIGNLLFGEAKKSAVESITGEKVQRVEVINFPEGFGNGLSSAAGSAATAAGGATATGSGLLTSVVAPAAAAAGVGVLASQAFKYVSGTTEGGGLEASINELVDHLRNSGRGGKSIFEEPRNNNVRVIVDSKDKSLKAYERGSRGTSQ